MPNSVVQYKKNWTGAGGRNVALKILGVLGIVAIILMIWNKFFNRPWGIGFFKRHERDHWDELFFPEEEEGDDRKP